MNKVKVLIQGYAHSGKNGTYIASPSCVLIESNGKRIIVDPGANSKKLEDVLNKERLTTKDIDAVFLSHYHPDHFLAIRMFPGHDIIDGEIIWRSDKEIFHDGKTIPGTQIMIIKTPGHSPEHCALLVETEKGKVCIAQDVFWWEDGKQKSETVKDLMKLKDPFVSDKEALKKSREKVLKLADWIIPGHGKMFKNPNKNRKTIYNDVVDFVDNSIGQKLKHFDRTVYWVKKMKPDADEALIIAAYSHDIQRAFGIKKVIEKIENSKTGFQNKNMLKIHQEDGARIMKEYLSKIDAPKALIERVGHLISKHEIGGDDDQNLLKDADSLSFFETNVEHFIKEKTKKFGYDKVRKKFDWMYNRITSRKAKELARPMYQLAIKKINNVN